jgi:hypothetical protein
MSTHLAFNLLWRTKCQPKHKVFFWLLLQDKLNTRDRLRRRNMHLESYTCENYILQRHETSYHLFLRCNFEQACWSSIGVITLQINCSLRVVMRLQRQLNMIGAMEVIILMSWSKWKCRNGWIFDNILPTVERCRSLIAHELKWLLLRVKPATSQSLCSWMESVLL